MHVEAHRFLAVVAFGTPAEFFVAANLVGIPLTEWVFAYTGALALLTVRLIMPVALAVLAFKRRSMGIGIAIPLVCMLLPYELTIWYNECSTGRLICNSQIYPEQMSVTTWS